MKLAKRVEALSPSATLEITAQAKRMKQAGAIEAGFTKYTPSSGIVELKEAVCEKLKKDNKN